MFLLTRTRRPAAAVRSRPVRPWLEALESRYCPTPPVDPSLSLGFTFVNQDNVKCAGRYTGTNVANQAISIQGQGWSASATTDANGYYSVTVAATHLGAVTATVVSSPSVQDQETLTAAVPQITNFVAIQEANGQWEFKGTITGTPDPQGMTITFGGLSNIAGNTTTVLSDGTFDVVFTLGTQEGFVTATTTDWWGQNSPQASTYV
jgi:hypothetical protein